MTALTYCPSRKLEKNWDGDKKRCNRCKGWFDPDEFYRGGRDSYCKACRSAINRKPEPRRVEVHLRGLHTYPTATRKCTHCGITYANFVEFWPSKKNVCVFCGGGK